MNSIPNYFWFCEVPNYSWHREGDMAILSEPFHEPIRYDKTSIELTVSNIESRALEYATPAAWKAVLRKYTEGLDLFK